MTQQYLNGTEPPGHSPEIEAAIATKYERIAALKLAREAVKISDATLLELMEEQGRALYPFIEPGTGRKKKLKLDATRKLKTVAGKSAKKEQADAEWEAAQAEHRGGDQQDAGREQWEAEVKRRRGRSVEDDTRAELDSADPFAATRAAMDTDDANVADQRHSDETSAQAAVREAETARAARRNKRTA